ncbi:MAG: hypothetical protein JW866_09075 [Ignavibacteriales bacterium]|nr:hypothetical protein [Ignavibacteriales bacterium]
MTPGNQFIDDLANGRETTINWQNVVKNIVDEYENKKGIVHGVQKDAIQNGWDARIDEKGKGWTYKFQLYREAGGLVYLTMTDSGTHGLTGRILSPEEMEEDLPIEERWGRFESLAFTKDNEVGTLGARGQGKFIFVGASKKKQIYYDSLRIDGTYRLGTRAIRGRTSSPVMHWDDEDGQTLLRERFPSLQPLGSSGTRVIIVDPIDEIIEAINNRSWEENVADTWWELLQKYKIKITVKNLEENHEVVVPQYILDMPSEDKDVVKVWNKKNETIDISGEQYRIKRLHLVSKSTDGLPEHIKGVAIQRNGMKVCTELPPRSIGIDIGDGIYGYIQFDKKLDELMALAESVTHYDFDWRRTGARQVREYIRDQITEFAHEKLGFGVDPRTLREKLHNEAEKRALLAANKVAKVLGISAGGFGGGGGVVPGPRVTKPYGLIMPELELPNNDLRVEFGQSVSNIKASVYNQSDIDFKVRLKFWMFTDDGQVAYNFFDPSIDFDLERGSKRGPFGPFSIEMERAKYPSSGLYRIRSRLISLESSSSDIPKGQILDEKTKSFYLDMNPPERIYGLFEKIQPSDLSEFNPTLLGYHSHGERGGYIYTYNIEHPAFKVVGDDRESSTEYLFRLLSQAVIEIDLGNDDPVLFNNEETSNPALLAQKIRENMGEWLHSYYS